MRVSRVTLRGVMVAVALAAANLALLREAAQVDEPVELLLLCGPTFLVLEVALWRAWRDRRPGRAIWSGYLLVGGLVTGSLAWAVTHSAVYGTLPNGGYGMIRPPSALTRFWYAYFEFGKSMRNLKPAIIGRALWDTGAATVLVVYGPQVAPAMLGGLVRRRLGFTQSRRSDKAVV